MDTICAAGWTTSSSRAIVPQSEDTRVFPRWLMISFFMPLGPAQGGLDDFRELFRGANVFQDGLVDAVGERRAFLHHALGAAGHI